MLEEAPVHARNAAEILQEFRYVPYRAVVPDGRAGYGELVEAAVLDEAVDVLIVHVVGHGELADGSSEKLYLLDSDGKRLSRPVSTWIDLIEDHPQEHRPVTLFVLDVCYAGEVAVTAWHAQIEPGRRRSWVLAATGPKEKAFGYRLSRALVEVLARYRDREPRFDPSWPYISPVTVWQDVERTVNELAAQADGLPQTILTSLAPAHADLSGLPFFPNPSYPPGSNPSPVATSGLPPEIARLTDWAADPMHFIRRASGVEPVHRDWDQGYFSGRTTQLATLAAWLDDDTAAPGLRVVTGKPGVGKSALLGILVCAAHPVLRRHTRSLWAGLGDLAPGENERIAVVHARRLTLDDVVTSLARQLRSTGTPGAGSGPGEASEPAASNPAGYLLGLLPGGGRPATIVIDALDEAQHPADITTALVLPLAQQAQASGGQLRLLVGTRDDERSENLLALARKMGGCTDLSTLAPQEVRRDVTAYVKQLLAADETYGAGALRPVREALANGIASALTSQNEPDKPTPGSEALQWGEFLTAGLYMHYLLNPAQPPPSVEEADRLGRAVPCSLPALLELDLQRHTDRPLLRPVLTALAFAQGRGMPETVLAHAATAFITPADDDHPMPLRDLYALLDGEARFYLRRDIDEDGTTLYRLFHEGLADWLRDRSSWPTDQGPAAPPVLSADPAQFLYERLLDTVPRDAASRRQWHLAAPYLLRHAAKHATDAGRLDELLNDGGYLQHADPHTLTNTLPHAHSEQARLNAAVYRASFAIHHMLTPAERRQILAVDAARFRNTSLHAQLPGDADWRVRWATGSQVSTALVRTFTGYIGGVQAVAVAMLEDRPHVITGDADGKVRVWDLTTGTHTQTLTRPTSGVNAVAVAMLEDRPHVITGDTDGEVLVWDLTTGTDTRTLTRHTRWVYAVTVAMLKGHPHAVTASDDGEVWVSDLTTDASTLTGHTRRVGAVALAVLEDRPHVITASDDGKVRVRDLNFNTHPRTLIGHTHRVRAAAMAMLEGRPQAVTASDDGEVRVWDLTTSAPAGALIGHTRRVGAVAVTMLEDRPHAVTGDADGKVRVWDLTTSAPAGALIGHTRRVGAVAVTMLKDRPHAVTASDDGKVLVWDLTTDTPTHAHALTGHTSGMPHGVYAVAVTMLEDRPHAVTASDDGKVLVWDLTTDNDPRTFIPHTRRVGAVAVTMLEDRPHAVTASDDGQVRVWDLTTHSPTRPRRLIGHTSWVYAVAVTMLEDRPHAVTGDADGKVLVWDLTTDTPTHAPALTGHTSGVYAVAVTMLEDRPHAVTGDADGKVLVWDLTTDTPTHAHALTGHTSWVNAVAVTMLEDRPHAVTGDADGKVLVWDLTTSTCLTVFRFPAPVEAVAVTAEATVVVGFGHEVAVLSLGPLKGRLR
ncbi:hypothetical protein [Streptomyces sp. NPDC005046]